MKKICVIGSLNMDLVVTVDEMPKKGETLIGKNLKEIPGGKGANQAFTMGRLGGDVTMIGKIGDDSFGDVLINNLKNNNVNTQYIQKEKGSSGVALITVDSSGENSIIVAPGANYKLMPEDIDKCIDAIKESDIVVFQLETPLETIKYALEKSKEMNKYTIVNPAPAKELHRDIIKNIDLLIPNETELELLSKVKIENEDDIRKAALVMIDKGIKKLIVTLGSKGSMYIDKDKEIFINSYKVDAVDTTAAGDSYVGSLAISMDEDKDISESMEFASKVAALCVMKEGAQTSIPTLDEVKKMKWL